MANVQKRIRSLQNHYKQVYSERGHPNFWMVIDPGDIATWYVLIHDLGKDHKGGEYLMRMTAPENYPFGPPKFELFTPNPRYTIGQSRPCVSMGEYHADNYPAILGMYGFTCELIYTFHASDKELGGGISMKSNVSKEEKLKLASESVAYNNTHYPQVMKLFEEERTRVFKNPLKTIEMPVETTDKSSDKSGKSTSESKKEKSKKIEEPESEEEDEEPEQDESTSETDASEESEASESISEEKPKKPTKSSKSKKETITKKEVKSKTPTSKTTKTSKTPIVKKSTKVNKK